MSILMIMFSSITLIALFFVLILLAYYCLKTRTSVHAPPSYPIIGCLLSFYKNRRRLLHWYTDLLSESPTQSVVVRRLGARRIVVTANPSNVEYILKTNFSNFPKGKPFTEILDDLLGRGIFNVDGDLWSTQRKLASHEFSTASLREFVSEALEEEVEERLVPLLESAAGNGIVLDLQEVLRRFAFDAVCKLSLGTDPCCLDLAKPAPPPLAEALDRATEICAMRGAEPLFFLWKVKKILNVGSERKLKEAATLVRNSVLDVIREKKGTKTTAATEQNVNLHFSNDNVHNFYSDRIIIMNRKNARGDISGRLLSAGHGEEATRDMVISFLLAARDTTSAAMTWFFWLLSSHPAVEEEILREISAVHGGDGGTTPLLSYEKLRRLKYMKACLCESMRLYPPVAWDSKHAAGDDVLPDGTRVRRGDRVTYFPYGMGRMEALWGPDRLEFKPDRWFEGPDRKVLRTVSPFKFPVFQAGPRVCLGKEMAFLQMKYVVASVLTRFEIRLVATDRPVFVPLLTAHMAGGLKVVVRKRKGGRG